MTLTDERRKRLTEYLGLCWHEGRMPINCGYRCVKCGDTYVVNRTFDNDADTMSLFRKMVDNEKLDNFLFWCSVTHFNFPPKIEKLFYKPERFCNLVAKWLEVKK